MWVSMNKDLLFPIRNESDLGLDGSGSLTWLSGGSHAMAGLQNCSVLGPWSQMATQPRVGAGRKGEDCSCQLNDMPSNPTCRPNGVNGDTPLLVDTGCWGQRIQPSGQG